MERIVSYLSELFVVSRLLCLATVSGGWKVPGEESSKMSEALFYVNERRMSVVNWTQSGIRLSIFLGFFLSRNFPEFVMD